MSFRVIPATSHQRTRVCQSVSMGADCTGYRNQQQGHSVTEFRLNHPMSIGSRIKEAREAHIPPLSVQELAARSGLARSHTR